MELQPVILAGGEGSRMYPLTENQAKCLLPIANIPMICYVVNYLEKCGFTEFIVVARTSYVKEIYQTLLSFYQSTLKFEMVSISDEDDIGTAEALALTKDKIITDVLVISCDMITEAPIHRLVDIHRMYDSSFTAMFADRVEIQTERDVKQGGSKNKQRDPYAGCRDFLSIEPTEKRLLFFTNESDFEEDRFSIRKSALKRYPNICLRTDLVDSHLFIMQKWMLQYLADNERFESLKSDFVPHIVRKQFSKQKKDKEKENSTYIDEFNTENEIRNKKDIFSYITKGESTNFANEWSGYQKKCLKDSLKCHAYHTDSFCLRVNTLSSYIYINRQIGKLHESIASRFKQGPVHKTVIQHGDSQIGKDCLIGERTILGRKKENEETMMADQKPSTKKFNKNIVIKKTVIGKQCNIGVNVRITNCVIMDRVTIEDCCVVQNSILCNNVCIQANCNLTNCQVSRGQTVKENTTLENESLVQEEMEFEEDDEIEESD